MEADESLVPSAVDFLLRDFEHAKKRYGFPVDAAPEIKGPASGRCSACGDTTGDRPAAWREALGHSDPEDLEEIKHLIPFLDGTMPPDLPTYTKINY